MVFESLVDIGVAFLIVVALAYYVKLKDKMGKSLNWLALAGVFLIFAGLLEAQPVVNSIGTWLGTSVLGVISNIFLVIGIIIALVGTVFAIYEMLVEK
jgi:hypothetical protein